MEKIFICVSDSGTIMGVFSDENTAEVCKKHYKKRLPSHRFTVESEYVDLLSASDYEE